MITSIFKKSKPINLVIAFFLTMLATLIGYFKIETHALDFNALVRFGILFLASLLVLYIFNLISTKNKLTQSNSFEIIIFGLFLLLLPQTTTSIYIILSNIFLLVSLRRIISVTAQPNIKMKFFDAAFWITIAALFYSWAIIFIALIPIAILLFTENSLRLWLIPITAVIAALLVAYSLLIVFNFDIIPHIIRGFTVSLNFENYNTLTFLIALTLLVSFGFWSSLFYIKNINNKKKAVRPAYYIILAAVTIAFIMVILSPTKTGSEFLFIMAPMAIIISNYIEIIREKWFKELFFLLLIIVPFILIVL